MLFSLKSYVTAKLVSNGYSILQIDTRWCKRQRHHLVTSQKIRYHYFWKDLQPLQQPITSSRTLLETLQLNESAIIRLGIKDFILKHNQIYIISKLSKILCFEWISYKDYKFDATTFSVRALRSQFFENHSLHRWLCRSSYILWNFTIV